MSAIRKLELDMKAERHKLAAAREEAKAKAADVEMALEEIDRSSIMSLVSGVVTQIHRYPGDWVDKGGKIATVVKMDRLQVKVRIPGDASGLTNTDESSATTKRQPGQLLGESVDLVVTSMVDESELVLAGRITRVIPELLGGRTIDAYIEFDNSLITNENGQKVWQVWLTQPSKVRVYAPLAEAAN